MTNFTQEFIAVGAAGPDGEQSPCVVVVTTTGTVLRMGEHAARKLADDLLRNANYLWPPKQCEHGAIEDDCYRCHDAKEGA